MTRVLGWIVIGLAVLAVVGSIVLQSLADGNREAIQGDIREGLFDMAGGGDGYQDGELVWQVDDELRITIEQLPTLEGRMRGRRIGSGFLTAEMSWFGVSLREAIAEALELPAGRVVCDGSLDTIWLDVDVARSRGLFESPMGGWASARSRILSAILDTYRLALTTELRELDITVLRAGPRWAGHLVPRTGESRVMRGDGVVELEAAPVELLLSHLRERLPHADVEGIDPNAICTLSIRWPAGDTEALRRVLADQLDLRVGDETRKLEVAIVSGVAVSPVGKPEAASGEEAR